MVNWLTKSCDQENDYLHNEPNYDYDISWDYERDDAADPSLIRLIESIVKEIQKKLLPRLKVFKTFEVIPIHLNSDQLATYINGTYSSPIIGIDLGNIKTACEEYSSNCGTAIETSIVHELGHALQEAAGKSFDEDEAEDFAFQWHNFREVKNI